MWKISVFLVAALAASCLAQDVKNIGGPVSGIVFDSQARSLRPVVGVPGAAYLGDELAGGLDFASVAPGGKMALAVQGGVLFLVRGLDQGSAELTQVAGAIESVDRAAWSGSAAAVYSSVSGQVQILRSLDSEAQAGAPALVAGKLIALVAGDSAAAFVTEDGAVYAAAGDTPRMIAQIAKPGALAAAGPDLFVTDRERNEVLRVANFAEAGDAALFTNAIADPVAVAVYRGRLFVASGSERAIAVFDAATGAMSTRIDIDFEPSRMEGMSGSLFLLNTGGAEPLQLLDAAQAPAVYFVPASRASE